MLKLYNVKSILILILVLAVSMSGFTQACISTKVINPAVTKPTTPIVVSVTCSTMVVKWTGSASQSYTVTATRYNLTTNIKDTVSGSTPTLISGQDYTSTILVVPGTQVT